ncbi:DUF3291 domain-containing protein [Fulvivirga sp. RKSG066]|uniref:DUF3291 domain-containing protein n=1 Tax=Fulvivirga aurantia TaxID=2529383 RepID=UPI0012BC5C01|nr:DUF3291 domain-containing protein [Fulvivirga aurantia]MTI22527.1 DUF3291 domain-containing protein [Fulvivirga aurantia]
MAQITTITLLSYKGITSKVWAFFMMQFAHKHLKGVQGLQFYKLMGSGRGRGFNAFPDWSTYALLQVWDDEASADLFVNKSRLYAKYKQKSKELLTLYMKPIAAKGEWSGANPFEVENASSGNSNQLAVLTRATIKWHKLYPFWKYVSTSQRPLDQNKGLIYTKGIGEVPVMQMATFSIWRDKSFLEQFAYGSKEHRKAIEKTKRLDWYKEELFVRFQPVKYTGSWLGYEQELDVASM